MRLRAVLAALGAVVATVVPAPVTAYAAPAPPNSMAALGDSITRARNACGIFFDCVARSWSTGWSRGAESHYRLISAVHPALTVHENDAADGRGCGTCQGRSPRPWGSTSTT